MPPPLATLVMCYPPPSAHVLEYQTAYRKGAHDPAGRHDVDLTAAPWFMAHYYAGAAPAPAAGFLPPGTRSLF
jgi:hypothetical protein